MSTNAAILSEYTVEQLNEGRADGFALKEQAQKVETILNENFSDVLIAGRPAGGD